MDAVPYATLINRRLVLPAEHSPYVSIARNFLEECLAATIARIKLDEAWYLERYPDVKQAIQARQVASGLDHYTRFGYFEHRMPYPVHVQESWYLQEYPDVQDAVRAGAFDSGQHHFELKGWQEGRVPFPNFRLDQR